MRPAVLDVGLCDAIDPSITGRDTPGATAPTVVAGLLGEPLHRGERSVDRGHRRDPVAVGGLANLLAIGPRTATLTLRGVDHEGDLRRSRSVARH